MIVRVAITEQAEREMQSAFTWWAEHRSRPQADRWYLVFPKPSPACRRIRRGMASPENRTALPMKFATFCLGLDADRHIGRFLQFVARKSLS
jgi:hypothetical protein